MYLRPRDHQLDASQSQSNTIMGIGQYVGEQRRAPNGQLYEWVEQADHLGNPVGFWGYAQRLYSKSRQRMRRVGRCMTTAAQIDTAKAIRLNRRYRDRYRWRPFEQRIERFLGFRSKPSPKMFAQRVAFWQCNRKLGSDGVIGPNTWREMQAAMGLKRQRPLAPPRKQRRATGISRAVLERIAQHAGLINRISKEYQFDANIVRGIIAGESGGKAKKVAASGYKGLMQAGKTPDQLDPEKSLRKGIEKFIKFRDRYLGPRLKRLGIDIKNMDKASRVKWVILAYNAGHVTVLKAVEYANASGNIDAWLEAEHYQRALFFSGGYSIKQAAKSLFKRMDSDTMAQEVVKVTNTSLSDVKDRYQVGGKWNREGLKQVLIKQAYKDWNQWRFASKRKQCRPWTNCPDPPSLDDLRKQVSYLTRYAVKFKHRNTPRYVARIVQYMQHYDRSRAGQP